MAHTKCPKCNETLMRGFWEVFTHCPNCGAEWATDPVAAARMPGKVALLAGLCALLSFVPVLGFVFGMAGIFLGVVAITLKKKIVGIACIAISAIVGIAGQPLLTYWGMGYYQDRSCQVKLATLSDSIYTYTVLTHQFPPDLQTMEDAHLNVPTGCPAEGGTYVYVSPSASQATSSPTSMPVALLSALPAATAPSTRPAVPAGDDKTLMVAEVLPDHRGKRMVVTSDFVVRAVPEEEFSHTWLELPQNHRFAVEFGKVWMATTQAAAGTPASQPATSQATTASTSQAATQATQIATKPAQAASIPTAGH